MKQETLLEVAERYSLELLEAKTIQPHEKTWIKAIFIQGAKWQAEQYTWYNEEQTNKRMNVIGQNGNDGTHYEKN